MSDMREFHYIFTCKILETARSMEQIAPDPRLPYQHLDDVPEESSDTYADSVRWLDIPFR